MSPMSIRTSRTASALESGAAKLWVLLLGVNHYQDEQLPSLQYSALDCQGLSAAIAAATQAFPQKEVLTYHDFAQVPTLAIARHSLHQITTAANPQDTVLFYFSGHGVLDGNTAYLCLSDTCKKDLADTGLSMVELLDALGSCAARQQLIWLDACHSGGMTLMGAVGKAEIGGEIGTSKTSTDIAAPLPNPTPQLVALLRQRATQSKGFYALLSCDQAQQSWEFPELGHGVFTYFLMRGLRGEAADSQGLIDADRLYKYVYHQTLRYIDKTNQQLRLINQQKRSRGETQVRSEYPLQTPKRIVEGIGELILGTRPSALGDRDDTPRYPRQALILEGLPAHPATLALSKALRNLGGFDLHLRTQDVDVRSAIQECLRSAPSAEAAHSSWGSVPLPDTEITLALLYLRGQLVETVEGESWLVLGPDLRLSRSWLRQALRQTTMTQQILILDCLGAESLASWVEDLQLSSDRSQGIIAATSPSHQPHQFLEMLVQTLEAVDPQAGLSIAGWMSQLQLVLAGTAIVPQFWLSGSQGVMEVLPGTMQARGPNADAGFDLGVCPYLGLRAFSEQDALYFYGREALTQQLIQTLRQKSVLAVIGASGSGKSSVVQAGLLAQLRQGSHVPGSEQWWLGCLRPGDKPLMALAQRLVDPGTPKEREYQLSQIEGMLYQGLDGFVQWLRSRPEPMVVLVVDQFEELFTLAVEPERQQFLTLLLGAAEVASDRFKLVFTLRTDFIAPCLENPVLATLLQQSSILVPPTLAPADYRQVILRPAERVGLQVEPELVEVLLEELTQSASDLPLLEFVLEQLWEHRQDGELTLQSYQRDLGGLKLALEHKAQEVYDALELEEQACARWIFLSLTQLGDTTEDTRRRVPKSDLVVKKYPVALVDRTLQVLTTAKLVIVGSEEDAKGQGRGIALEREEPQKPAEHYLSSSFPNNFPNSPPTVEVAHEILIRHWSTLRWWLDENRSRLRSQRQITEAALQWQQHGQSPDFLLQGVRLEAAEELYIEYTDELPELVQQFVEACLEQRQQQQRQQRQRLRRAQRTAVVIGVLGLAACGLAGFAFGQQRQAQFQEVEALAASSEALLASHQPLDSVLTSLDAGKKLHRLKSFFGIPLGVPVSTETKAIAALQQSLAHTQIFNRLDGHTNKVNSVTFSPDGQLMATASDDQTVRLWQRDGTLVQELSSHSDRVTQVAFSPDSQLFASSSADKTVKLWNRNGTVLSTIRGHRDWTTSVHFSPTGQLLATASRDKTVRLWRLSQGGKSVQAVRTLTGAQGWVNRVQFSPNGQLIVGTDETGGLYFWRVQGQNAIPFRRIKTGAERLTDVDWSPDGKGVIVASGDRTLKLYGLKGNLIRSFTGHQDQVNAVQFSPDGRQVISAGGDHTVRRWNLQGETLQEFQGHQAEINSVSFSPDGTSLATASTDKTVNLWATQNRFQPYGGGAHAVGFSPVLSSGSSSPSSPQNRVFATAGWDGKVYVWSVEPGAMEVQPRLIKTLSGHTAPITALSFSATGNEFASASVDKTVKLWSLADGRLIRTLANSKGYITALNFSPDGNTLVTGDTNRQVKLWNMADGGLMKTLEGHTDSVSAVQFSPNGQQIASAGFDTAIRLWRVDGTPLKVLGLHGLAIAALSYSPDGQQIATASWDNTIKVWSSEGGLWRTLRGHTDGVTSLAFSPDGKVLASGSVDTTLRLWDVGQGTLLKTLLGDRKPLQAIAFSPDGKMVVGVSEQGGTQVWNLDLENLLMQTNQRLQDYFRTHSQP